MRLEDSFNDLKLREIEIATMETEEKLGWDGFELPSRNRQRLIRDFQDQQVVARANAAAEAKTASREKEEGFTSFNGVVQEFARHKDSPALFHTYHGHTQSVNAFKISSDCNYFVSASSDCTIKLWDLNSQKCVRTLEGHSKVVFDCDLVSSFTKESPSGGRIVSASADKTIRIWDALLATCRKVIRGHTDVVYSCAFTPDGTKIASASADRSLRLWDAEEGHLVYVFGGHDTAILSCRFSPSGKYLLSSSDYGERSIKLWYTDMPFMEQKQVVGFRLIWEMSGVVRRVVAKYDPKPGFFTDHVGAKQEMALEDAADEEWDLEHPPDLMAATGGEGDTEEEVEAAKAAVREKEEETAALELADTPEAGGFSISVNSVDRFGRAAQVQSYYPGVELQVVLRGVDPFTTFFVSVYHKRAQFEAFEEKSGERVGSFSAATEETSETVLCCGGRAVSSPAMGVKRPLAELSIKWKAPTLQERAAPDASNCATGPVVVKATMARDPLSVGPDDDVNVGLVQVAYSLTEVEAPKKGRLLTEMSQRTNKEEKKFTVDVVANHQLFIDFVRNRDVFSAGTLLGDRVHMLIDGRDIQGREKVMEVLQQLMMQEGCAVVLKDAKLLCNGATTSALDRDKAVDKKKPESRAKKRRGGKEAEEEEESESESEEEGEEGVLRRAMVEAAPPGPKKWSAGPARVEPMRPRDIVLSRHRPSSGQPLGLVQRLLDTAVGASKQIRPEFSGSSLHSLMKTNSAGAASGGKAGGVAPGKAVALSLRSRAEAELDRVLRMRRAGLAVSEEVRKERLVASSSGKGFALDEEEEEELLSNGKFGVSEYRMILPSIYPATAVGMDEAITNAKKVKKELAAQKEQLRRKRAKSNRPRELSAEEREKLVEEMMVTMAASEVEGKEAAMGRRQAAVLLPGLEDMAVDLGDSDAVKGLELGTRLPGSQGAMTPTVFGRDGFDPNRRRNAFPTLPGFRGKVAQGDFAEMSAMDELAVARSSGNTGLIRAFAVEAFEGVMDSRCHHNSINQADFSFDEKRVASGSSDGTVRLWDTKSGHLVSTLLGHEAAVNSVAFSDEGQRLVSSGLDNFLILWNVATGLPLRRLYGHDDAVKHVCFFSDSTALLSCGGDSVLKVWYLTPQAPAAPGKPRITHKTTQTMTVAWKAPPAFNEEITAFQLQYRVGIREAFAHDVATPGDQHSFEVRGLKASTPYQFRVRGVNRMGQGHWSEPSAQTVASIDVPDGFERPEILEVTPYAIGIKWRAPTATIEGTSIGRFVVQLAGAGLSYEDKVQQVITWAEGRSQLTRYEERHAAMPEESKHLGVGQTSNRNLEILLENRAKKMKFQVKLLAREKEKRLAQELAEQRQRWERGDFIDPKERKRKEREERRIRKEQKLMMKQGILVVTDTSTDDVDESAAAVGSTSTVIATSERMESGQSGESFKLEAASARATGVGGEEAEALMSSDGGERLQLREKEKDPPKSNQNMVEHFFLYEGLRPGYMYRLRVAGVSSMGQGKWSPTTFSTNTLATEPAQPDPPVVHPKHVRMFGLKVEWLSPNENGSAIVSFAVKMCHDETEVLVSQNCLHLDLISLQPGERYTFRVRASNQQGASAWSEESEPVCTLTSKAEVPSPPSVLQPSGIDWVDLEAARPFANGSAVVGWIVQCREISMSARASWGKDLTLPVLEILEGDDDESNDGNFELYDQDGDDDDDDDDDFNAAGPVDSTAAGVALPKNDGNERSVQRRGSTSMSEGTSSVLSLRGAEKRQTLPKCLLRVTGLLADRTYDFRVCALNEHGSSGWSTASARGRTKPPKKPSPPKKLRVDELYPNAVVFSWDEPAFHGAEVVDYCVEQQRTARPPSDDDSDGEGGGEGDDEDQAEAREARQKERDKDLNVVVSIGSGTLTSLRMDDLAPYSTYKFRVAATNSVGRSPWSPWTPEIQPTDSCMGDPVEY